MKVKGIQNGKIIEFSPEEKVVHALQEAASSHEDLKGYLVHVNPSDIKFGKVDCYQQGKLLADKFQNSKYGVRGTASFNRRHIVKDQIHRALVKDFELTFCDKLDSWGQPDIQPMSLVLSDPA